MRSQFLVFLSLVMLSVSNPAIGSNVTQQPTLADYKDGEKWVWKYKGVTSSGEVRADGTDTKK